MGPKSPLIKSLRDFIQRNADFAIVALSAVVAKATISAVVAYGYYGEVGGEVGGYDG